MLKVFIWHSNNRPMLALRVKREKVEELRLELFRLGVLDGSRKFVVEEEFVEIPVLGVEGVELERWGATSIEQEDPVKRADVHDPRKDILGRIDIPDDLIELLPRKWELLGDVLILKLHERLDSHRKNVAKAYADVLGAETVLQDVGGIVDEFRKPRVKMILGERTETVHKENGFLFKLDAKEIMFSSGNIDERIR
ncbi:MAG: hypothetical protein KAW09_12625, partial [Thermoplasmata archaeon]|nr:hypothetical protein [Thermoplasmata archaeon]